MTRNMVKIPPPHTIRVQIKTVVLKDFYKNQENCIVLKKTFSIKLYCFMQKQKAVETLKGVS